jgi:type IV pilus assembly protein PilC
MPKFLVTAKDAAGRVFNEVVDSSGSNQAVLVVQAKGLFVTAVKSLADEDQPAKKTPSAVNAARVFAHSKVSLDDIISFSRQLATMIEAGVPLMRSLRIIADQVESRELAGVLNEIVADVEQGQPFSRALTKHPKVFSPFWVSLVEVGEASGTMPKVLEKLTLYMEEAAAFRSHIIGALIYPGVLFTICVGAILVFAVVIGPTFERIFADMNVKLPVITQMLMGLFKIVQTKFLFIIGGFVGAFFIFKSYIKTSVGRKNFELFLFGLPGFGNVFKLIVVEKFCSQMAILIDSGVPILYALEIAERLVDNLVCAEHIKHVRDGVREGRLLAEPMEQSGFFPPMAVQMIRVGEETGELGQMLNHVAVFYKKQVEAVMKTFGTLIEPVMLVVMGGIIGVMVVAMFMPILSLSTGG